MHVVSHLLAFDSPLALERQEILLRLFVENISPNGMNEITHNHTVHRPSSGWYGIQWNQRVVTEVHYEFFEYGNFNISALPHSVHTVFVSRCAQTFRIHTRRFPREIENITLSWNKISGRIDLTELPRRLKNANFTSNRIRGPIILSGLPPCLERLILLENRIRQSTVYYENLPESLKFIYLDTGVTRRYAIHEIRPMDPCASDARTGIFLTLKASQVH
mmetsp:Transcript_19409/g.30406  ORF Transcript_19409/g.30406 Transcript_19409/m.30406 type:complete len:219 (-) Transcript_19409:14-670(-)